MLSHAKDMRHILKDLSEASRSVMIVHTDQNSTSKHLR